MGEPATAAPQGHCWNQRPGKNPGLITAEELYFARPGPSIQTQTQDVCFIPARMTPALSEYAHLKTVWTTLTQAPGQRAGIEEPMSQFRRQIARDADAMAMPMGSLIAQDSVSVIQGLSFGLSPRWRKNALWHGCRVWREWRQQFSRILTRYLCFESWDDLIAFMLDSFEPGRVIPVRPPLANRILMPHLEPAPS